MASLEVLRVYWGKFGKILFLFRQSMSKKTTIGFSSSGVRGNLQESESYTASNLIATGPTVLLVLYFIIWQSYVL
uniref:Uncharacterized protein n=1 Tax=Cyprinus carpio TaxID=7962 RepID=A0A8C1XQZ3_CYPCA